MNEVMYAGSHGHVWEIDKYGHRKALAAPFPGFAGSLSTHRRGNLMAVGAGPEAEPLWCVLSFEAWPLRVVVSPRLAFEREFRGGVNVQFSPDGGHVVLTPGPGGAPVARWVRMTDLLPDVEYTIGTPDNAHGVGLSSYAAPPPVVVETGVPLWFSGLYGGVVGENSDPITPGQWARLRSHLARLPEWAVDPVVRNQGGMTVISGRSPAFLRDVSWPRGGSVSHLAAFAHERRAYLQLDAPIVDRPDPRPGDAASVSPVLHEWFHALDFCTNTHTKTYQSNTGAWMAVYRDAITNKADRTYRSRPGHYTGTRGPSEYFAESGACYVWGTGDLPRSVVDYWDAYPALASRTNPRPVGPASASAPVVCGCFEEK